MLDKFHDECGVFGILDHKDAANLVYLGLYALQHRGQESAGIAAADGEQNRIVVEKEMGYVADVFTPDRMKRLPGDTAIGHVRYSTAGGSMLCNAQPIVASTNKGPIAVAHNGNLVNGEELRARLEDEGAIFNSISDTEVVVHLIARSKEKDVERAFVEALSHCRGAYSMLLLTPTKIFAARDPYGFRPLVLGRLDDSIAVSSETCAFDLIGAEYIRDVKPGELIVVGPEGVSSRFYSTAAPQSSCIFEHVYFSRPDSLVFGRSVQTSREELGRQLAREAGVDADLVVPVPDSGVTAGVGYAAESGIPFRFALIRNHYVGRTFIEPSQSVRDFGVKLKLNPVRSLLEGKRIVLIDDSIVRGTTSRKIVRMVRSAGATEVHMRISCPPTISPCYYGVDTPSRKQLIAANKSVDEIREYIGADSLAYLSLEGLKKACGEGEKISYCSACYTGKYPTDIVDIEEIQPASVRR